MIATIRAWWRDRRPVVLPRCEHCHRPATGRWGGQPVCSDCHALAIRHGNPARFTDHPPGTLTVRNGHPVAGGRRLHG